jgi:hypothetical protein
LEERRATGAFGRGDFAVRRGFLVRSRGSWEGISGGLRIVFTCRIASGRMGSGFVSRADRLVAQRREAAGKRA